MGIYPRTKIVNKTRNADGSETWIEEEHTPGLVRKRGVIAEAWVEDRTDCFCCSCPDEGGRDIACRNHGFAASRPCEVHNMPGQPYDDGEMPESVQKARG